MYTSGRDGVPRFFFFLLLVFSTHFSILFFYVKCFFSVSAAALTAAWTNVAVLHLRQKTPRLCENR
jgi:hypothetical protein